jgi:3-methyl-2-oxobutanoate hydroxymethyltransferase
LRQYLNLHDQVTHAVHQYIHDVKAQDFPNESEQY